MSDTTLTIRERDGGSQQQGVVDDLPDNSHPRISKTCWPESCSPRTPLVSELVTGLCSGGNTGMVIVR